ncbi:ATP-binding protein [Mariniphaga sp.]|uniref:ATP-binding protein n=1 Tax=Mariniphaga sp. TaxID=1954475 RepID=UPI003561B216
MEQLKKIIQELTISEEDKALIFQQIKAVEKTIAIAEFKYNRTVLDKAAITNVLNASIQEIEKQKKDIEAAKNEISQNLIELDAQKKLIEEKNIALNKAINKLKSTQTQLIQAEKMASLGELTAGIAHEIQNPLNFVNNFSELSKELIGEMNEELAVGNWQLAKEIAGDVEHNLEKINHHGKRAADIVKGMLQHSRTSTGLKEPTDINALADEYLRLAYHGFKAKDKSFKAQFKTDFDPNLPKINLVPQDIGRVLLNLINNAFYAVKAPPPPKGGIKETQSEYKPLVIVKTSHLPPSGGMRGACLISVADNGNGIPDSIKDKIFQPFFTTKPTGSGTGLGLSLSYDIVKAHGGELKVDSQEGIGTVFSVILKNKVL